jgi:hypothetical protein
MPKLKDQIEGLTKSKHRLAVWEALASYLQEQFTGRDGRPAQKAIKVPECLVEVVPEETIESVLQAIGDGPISELRGEIAAIEDQEVLVISPGGKSDVQA